MCPSVRVFAVQHLASLSDDELLGLLLQLTQILQAEPFLDCALSRYLLRRAISSPEKIGCKLFWFLKAEADMQVIDDFKL